jgi:orotidine-5'-phosphate decarboxylase
MINTNLSPFLSVGLDPRHEVEHKFFRSVQEKSGDLQLLIKWAEVIIDCAEQAGIRHFKLQSAFFESFGDVGIKALKEIGSLIHQVKSTFMLDAKRGDIGSTMTAYGQFAFDYCQADSMTIHCFFGKDSLEALRPWLNQDKSVYIVLLTSTGGGDLFQQSVAAASSTNTRPFDLILDNIASMEQFHPNKIGLVIGAQRFAELSGSDLLRLKTLPILMPGLGAQKGEMNSNLASWAAGHQKIHFPGSRAITGNWSLKKMDAEVLAISSWKDYEAYILRNIQHFATNDLEPLRKCIPTTL